jgi:signal transduction histidine kinase
MFLDQELASLSKLIVSSQSDPVGLQPGQWDRARLAELNSVALEIHAAGLNIDTLFQAIRQNLTRIIPLRTCALYLYDSGFNQVRLGFFSDEDKLQQAPPTKVEGVHSKEFFRLCEALPRANSSVLDEQFQLACQLCRGQKSNSTLVARLGSLEQPLGLLCVNSDESRIYDDSDAFFLEAFAEHVSIALGKVKLINQFQKRVITAERKRLARDLHDSVTQLLYSMTLLSSGWKSMAAAKRLEDPAGSFGQLEEIGLRCLKEMRLLIHQLRPSVLEEHGLVRALQHRLESVEQRVNISTHLLVDGEFPALPKKVEEELYSIAMEALNNALRHADASEITVRLRNKRDRVVLNVIDNGVGFGRAKISAGLGFISMRERAESIDARLWVTSKPSEGTTVSVSVTISNLERG